MKKLFVAGVAAVALYGAPVFAADMPVKGPIATAAPYDPWTGCYVGGNLGKGWARDGWDETVPGVPFARNKPDGFVGGGQTGCDYQSGSWVVGLRGLFDWSNMKGSGPDLLGAPGFTEQSKIRDFETATARLGVLLQPNSLLYVNGGFATAKFRRTEFDDTGAVDFTTPDTRHPGWTIGVGWEWMFAPSWSFFVEYDYFQFSGKHLTTSGALGLDTVDPHINAVLVGLNYRFSTGKGPVVAKY
jgi:outer membrane immunogenic protein